MQAPLFPFFRFGWQADSPVTVLYRTNNNTSRHTSPQANQTCMATVLKRHAATLCGFVTMGPHTNTQEDYNWNHKKKLSNCFYK